MSSDKQYTAEEVAQHNKAGDCWVIIDSTVYDVSTFLEVHPGGSKTILRLAGKDASKEFHALHNAQRVLQNVAAEYKIGVLKQAIKAKL